MSKKERVKGKGADIFFSENQVSCCFDNHSESSVETTKKAEDKDEQSEELATKATFYFTQSQLDALEKAVFLLKQEYRIKTNKSEVMRIALESIIKELEEKKKDSALFLRLAG